MLTAYSMAHWSAYQCIKDAKQGVIINTASVTGIYGSLSGIGYPTSKAGVIGLTHWSLEERLSVRTSV